MRRLPFLVFILVLMFLSIPSFAQTPLDQFRAGAVGIGYFSNNSPAFMGRGALFLPIGSSSSIVSYTASDIGVVKSGGQIQVAQLQLTYKFQSGLAYKFYAKNWLELWGLAAPGFVANGADVKSAFQYGAVLGIKTGKGPEILIPLTVDTQVSTKFNPALMVAFRF